MLVTVSHTATWLNDGADRLVYLSRDHEGTLREHELTIGDWRKLKQWTDQLRGRIDLAMLAGAEGARRRAADIGVLVETLAAVIAAPLPEAPPATGMTLYPHAGLPRYLPWEALSLVRPGLRGALAIDVDVRVSPRRAAQDPVALMILDPEGAFSSEAGSSRPVRAHFEHLAEVFARAGRHVVRLAGNAATYENVATALADPALDLVYFFGHGETGSGDGSLALAHGGRLFASDIADQIMPRAHIVMLNACASAASSPAGTFAPQCAEAFRHSGAHIVAGATQRIPWPMAIAADEGFLVPLLTGARPCGQVASTLRRASLERFEQHGNDFTWSTFRLIGDVAATAELDARSTAPRPLAVTDAVPATPVLTLAADIARGRSRREIDMPSFQSALVQQLALPGLRPAPPGLRGGPPLPLAPAVQRVVDRHESPAVVLRALLTSGEWDREDNGVESSDVTLALEVADLLEAVAPLDRSASRIVERVCALTLERGSPRLTNRAIVAALLEDAHGYLRRALTERPQDLQPAAMLMHGLIERGERRRSGRVDTSALTRWLQQAEHYRRSGRPEGSAPVIDERALVLAAAATVPIELRAPLAHLPAPFAIDLEAASTRVVDGERSRALMAGLDPSGIETVRSAHAAAQARAGHPIALRDLVSAIVGGQRGDDVRRLRYPLDDAHVWLLDQVASARRRYGTPLGGAGLFRAGWLSTPAATRRAERGAARLTNVLTSVEVAMLHCDRSDTLLQLLDSASGFAAQQGHAQVHVPHLYAARLQQRDASPGAGLGLGADDLDVLSMRLLRTVQPRAAVVTLASGLSASSIELIQPLLGSEENEAQERIDARLFGAFRHPVVDAVLAEFR